MGRVEVGGSRDTGAGVEVSDKIVAPPVNHRFHFMGLKYETRYRFQMTVGRNCFHPLRISVCSFAWVCLRAKMKEEIHESCLY